MSRNPYLAASRPTSSFTRSSRTSSRTGVGSSMGGPLGRSRSSATLGGLTSLRGYIPSWQRSSSSTRYGDTSSSSSAAAVATGRPSATSTTTSKQRESPAEDSYRVSSSLNRSSSSHGLSALRSTSQDDDNDDNDRPSTNQSHLKNYQQNKLNQPQPTSTTRTTRSSLQSLGSDTASTDNLYSRTATKSTTSLDSAASSAAAAAVEAASASGGTDDDYEDSIIGDNIPSGSARHLRQSGQQHGAGQLSKSKSLDIGGGAGQQEAPILFSSMSVDRLLLRADSMGERDLRKSFKELVMENERLKHQLKGFDEKDKQRQQDWIKRERQLHRKISELEEENKQIEHWKQEIQRLKDENNSLIRVVSKLSKQN